MSLEGKIALVTGAAQGIGEVIARSLAKDSATTVLFDINSKKVFETAAKIEAETGHQSIGVAVDIRNKQADDDAVKRIEDLVGAIDILVNNAGIWRKGFLLETSEKDWDDVLAVNVKGLLFCSQAVAPAMINRRYGKIVNIASVAAFSTGGDWGAYCASKALAVWMTQSLANDLQEYDVQVNAVCPGATDTPMLKLIEQTSPGEVFYNVHTPEDVAAEVLRLVDPFSQKTTGTIVRMK